MLPRRPGRSGRGRRRPAVRRAVRHLRLGPGRGAGRQGSAVSTSWTAGPPPWGEGCLRSAEPSWRNPAGAATEIVRELERVRGQSGMLLTVDTLRQPAALGPGIPRKGVDRRDAGREADPVIRRCRTGGSGGPGQGPGQAGRRGCCRCWTSVSPRGPKVVRFGVAHAEAPEMAERVRTALVAAYQPRDCFVTLATGVLGTHVGPGRLGGLLPGGGRPRRRADGVAEERRRMTQTPEALRLALDAIQDLKANELVVLDLRGLTDATDYFVIASGHLRRPRPGHRGVGDREAGRARSPHPSRRRADRRTLGADRLRGLRGPPVPPGDSCLLSARAPLGRCTGAADRLHQAEVHHASPHRAGTGARCCSATPGRALRPVLRPEQGHVHQRSTSRSSRPSISTSTTTSASGSRRWTRPAWPSAATPSCRRC